VSSHGTEACCSTEGESSKASHVEVGVVNFTEVTLQRTVNFIAAERGCYETCLFVVSLLLECFSNLAHQFWVGKSIWKGFFCFWKGCSWHEVINLLSFIVVKLEAEWKEVVWVAWRSVDLNSSKNCGCSVRNRTARFLYNATHQLGLCIIKCIWQLLHLLLSSIKSLRIWHKHWSNEVLLGIKRIFG